MEINGLGYSLPQDKVKENQQDSERQIDVLEKKKEELEQRLKKEDSPFALQQSKEYESIKKSIEKLDKEIQQLEASKESNSTSEVPSKLASNGNEKSNNALSSKGQFDEFIHSADQDKQSSAGIYSIATDEEGNAVISFGE